MTYTRPPSLYRSSGIGGTSGHFPQSTSFPSYYFHHNFYLWGLRPCVLHPLSTFFR
uniref:Uncharacterized protein n=1 Tax=Arundo donax TaxID=35708 RepID=A0A0A9CJA1_ARUDO